VFFNKGRSQHPGQTDSSGAAASQESYSIDFDIMTKGHVISRGRKQVRQIGVTVHGATRLVTSGDVVDRETYEALIAIGAIAPPGTAPRKDLADPGVAARE
jgi:hypothetical protein